MGLLIQFPSSPLDASQAAPKAAGQGPLVQTGSVNTLDMKPCPLDPSWILEGQPRSRIAILTDAKDANFSCGVWDCTAGKIKFKYLCDEIVHILEGEVIVEEPGRTYTLKSGDVAFLPEGVTADWTIPTYVKKFAIFRTVHRTLLQRICSRLRRIVGRLVGG